jgi:hypothetical protein
LRSLAQREELLERIRKVHAGETCIPLSLVSWMMPLSLSSIARHAGAGAGGGLDENSKLAILL